MEGRGNFYLEQLVIWLILYRNSCTLISCWSINQPIISGVSHNTLLIIKTWLTFRKVWNEYTQYITSSPVNIWPTFLCWTTAVEWISSQWVWKESIVTRCCQLWLMVSLLTQAELHYWKETQLYKVMDSVCCLSSPSCYRWSCL